MLSRALVSLIASAPADPAATEAATAAANVTVNSVWDFVLKGGFMMIPLGLCSFIAFALVAERLASLRRTRIIPTSFVPGLRDIVQARPNDRQALLAYCQQNSSPIGRVFASGFRRLGTAPLEVVERHVEEAGQREVLRMRRNLRALSVIAAVSPLLGLLGTILGMIDAFQTVATSGEALGKTELLADGIYAAMITTAAGLIVAIPVLICYHWLSARVERLVMEIDEATYEFIEDLAADSTPMPAAAPVPTARDAAAAKSPARAQVAAT